MTLLLKLSLVLDRIITVIGRLAAWLAVVLIVVILFDVITRRFLVLGSTKLQEFEWHLHAVLFLFCLGFAYITDSHVRIDIVRERLSQRVQWWIELIGCLFVLLPYCAIVLYFAQDFVHRSWVVNEASDSATGLPYRWLIKSALPIGILLLFLSGVVVLARKLIELFGPPELRHKVSDTEKAEIKHLDEVDSPG